MSLTVDEEEAERLAREIAELTGRPLLFKGDDFALTDIHPAIPA
jgi:uncharacterized protein with PIN domain